MQCLSLNLSSVVEQFNQWDNNFSSTILVYHSDFPSCSHWTLYLPTKNRKKCISKNYFIYYAKKKLFWPFFWRLIWWNKQIMTILLNFLKYNLNFHIVIFCKLKINCPLTLKDKYFFIRLLGPLTAVAFCVTIYTYHTIVKKKYVFEMLWHYLDFWRKYKLFDT